jgi:signal peptidase II
MTRIRALAAICALGVLLLNLVIEHAVMAHPFGGVLISGLADVRLTWNRGVSFSLLSQANEAGRHLMIVLLAALALGLAVMAWRARGTLAAAGFGLILGGALGNLLDRALYGLAVFDFLFLHLGALALFVCNFSDIAISAGALLLSVDGLRRSP